ncbi:MAG: hypothetical protein FJ148_10030 [Deltaproteobacteria bacterium]|nr:hypothetical protein [Deltaproteobacteria bacterium]
MNTSNRALLVATATATATATAAATMLLAGNAVACATDAAAARCTAPCAEAGDVAGLLARQLEDGLIGDGIC